MERANSNLLLQNLCIMQQNEELRRKARQLDRENKALLTQLQRQQQQQQAASSTQPAAASQAQGSGSGHSDLKATGGGKKPK